MHRYHMNPIAMLMMVLTVAFAGVAVAAPAKDEAGEQKPGLPIPATLTAAKFAKAPTVDGTLDVGEWDLAARTTGFLEVGNSPWTNKQGRFWLDPRGGHTLVGYTADRLYIAVVSDLPPDLELVTHQQRDESMKTVSDDSIEVWVADPNTVGTEYQTIVNAGGAIFDLKHSREGSDQSWNGQWELQSTIDKDGGVWIAEMSAPFSAFALTGDMVGQQIKLLVARNFKRPWAQAIYMPGETGFRSSPSYPTLRLTADEPVVQVLSVGDYGDNNEHGPLFDHANLKLKLRIVNPGPARKAKVALATESTDMPGRAEEKTIELPAGGAAEYDFELPVGFYHGTAAHLLNYSVADAEGDTTWLNAGMMWTLEKSAWNRARATPWQVVTGPQPDRATGLTYYPSYNRLRVRVDVGMLGKDHAGTNEAQVTVADAAGKTLAQKKVTWQKPPAEEWLDLPELADGKYTVTFNIDGYKEALVDTFARKHFEWEGNTLGITDAVLPPFTPITVDGQNVGVVLRKYKLTGLGLWESVQAKGQDADEDFKELLTGPVQLVADGDQPLEGEGQFVSKAENKVVYEGKAQHPAVNVSLRNTIEEDGCMKVELTLSPGSQAQELKSLSLLIPMKDALAPLYHVVNTAVRSNPAGATPSGQGKVWTSYSYPVGSWYENFHPYIWLGGEARGLCWFADNDKGWVIDANTKQPELAVPPQEMHRDGDTLTLQVNLVQKPITLAPGDEPRTIVFGLMASPAKPMAKNWRAIGRRDEKHIVFTMGWMYGLPATFCAKYPINRDFAIFEAAQALRRGEPVDTDAVADTWVQRNVPDDAAEEVRKYLASAVRTGIGRGKSTGKNALSVYFDEFHSTSAFLEESAYYRGEWSGRPQPKKVETFPPSRQSWMHGFNSAGIVPSYRDFAVWYAAEWLKRGFGIYFDNSFPISSFDTLTTSAFELPNGEIQPSAGLWARREYLRRVWTLHQQLRLEDTPQVMMIHMTNTHMLPYMVWNESNLDLEWKVSAEPIQAKFMPEVLRAESSGLQTGNIPLAFNTVKVGKENKDKAELSNMALFVHEIKPGVNVTRYPEAIDEFGYGLPDCKVVNYWDENIPLSVSDERCKWLLLERGDKRMVILATWNSEPSEVIFRLQATPTSALDAQTGEALTVRDGQVVVPMEAYGARIVQIESP